MEETTAFLVAVVGDLERIWPLVAFSIGLVGAVIAAAAIPVLQQDSSFEQIRDWMVKPGMASRYRHLVLFGLKAARGYYGPKPCLSWRGYNACFLVAMIYPILLWQLAWVLDGPAMIGGIAGFDEAATSTKRWLSLFAFWAYLLLVFVVFRYLDQISEFGARQISRVLPHVILNRPAAETVLRAFVTVGAVVVVVAVGAGGAVLYLTILIIIPATNAGLDHISVQFSRWLLLHMVRRRGAARQAMLMAVHVTADIVFALLCLGMLAVLLPSVLQTANRVFDLAGC